MEYIIVTIIMTLVMLGKYINYRGYKQGWNDAVKRKATEPYPVKWLDPYSKWG